MNNKGVGLGLIICQHLCQAHNGQIWLHSREMEGSTFSFTMQMPAVNNPDAEAQPHAGQVFTSQDSQSNGDSFHP